MKFDDKRIDSLAQISLENSRIVLEQPIIFLCGGLVDIKSPTSPSIRDALVSHLHSVRCELADRITLAEDFKDWIHDAIYRDLLVFESDIAHISSLIIIILESAGALTELGLFVKNESLRNKILVFVSQSHYEESSFISLGPLRHLRDIKESSVCAYPWSNSNPTLNIKDSLIEMREDIIHALASQDRTEAFSKENEGHISFATYEIIKTFRALRLTEIESYLQKINLDIPREKIKRLLFLLEKFDLISKTKRGHVDYYYAKSDIKKVEFGGKFDQLEAKLAAQQFYATNDSESKRLSVISFIYNAKEDQANAPDRRNPE